MEEEKEVCYFSGKNGECSVLHSECTGTRSRQLCSFFQTEKEFYHNRNVAIVLCRIKGKCDNCKYQSKRCELVRVGGESV